MESAGDTAIQSVVTIPESFAMLSIGQFRSARELALLYIVI